MGLRFTETGIDIEKHSFRQIFKFFQKNIKHKKVTEGFFSLKNKAKYQALRESMVKSAGPEWARIGSGWYSYKGNRSPSVSSGLFHALVRQTKRDKGTQKSGILEDESMSHRIPVVWVRLHPIRTLHSKTFKTHQIKLHKVWKYVVPESRWCDWGGIPVSVTKPRPQTALYKAFHMACHTTNVTIKKHLYFVAYSQ